MALVFCAALIAVGLIMGSARAAVETDACDVALIYNDALFVNVVNDSHVHIGYGSVVVVVATAPVSAVEPCAGIPEAIVNSSVEADSRSPVAAVPNVEAFTPTPIAGGPEEAGLWSNHPRAWNPEIVLVFVAICPVARGPDVARARADRLRIDGQCRRADADRNAHGNLSVGRSRNRQDSGYKNKNKKKNKTRDTHDPHLSGVCWAFNDFLTRAAICQWRPPTSYKPRAQAKVASVQTKPCKKNSLGESAEALCWLGRCLSVTCYDAGLPNAYSLELTRNAAASVLESEGEVDTGAKVQIQPSIAKIEAAQKFLARHFAPTRLAPAPFLSQRTGKNVYLKLETDLPTGSFKVRGAFYALAERMKKGGLSGVVASSTGNHGAAVAYAGREFGIAAKIFLPANCNPVKRARIEALGAAIVESGECDLASAFKLASEQAKQPGVYLLNDATDLDLPAGPATIACEILEQLSRATSVLVPMGDTALIRGIGAATKQVAPHVRVIGVQAENAPAYYRSWKEGRVVGMETCDTIADGLATRTPEAANVQDVKSLVDDVVLVSEEEMLQAIGVLVMEEHVVTEPAGAASTAALLKSSDGCGNYPVLIVSGANVSREVLKRAIQNA